MLNTNQLLTSLAIVVVKSLIAAADYTKCNFATEPDEHTISEFRSQGSEEIIGYWFNFDNLQFKLTHFYWANIDFCTNKDKR